MPDLKTESRSAKYLIDDITLKIVDTLLDNPSIPYNKNQLAEASEISRDSLYRRWSMLQEYDILQKSQIGSKASYWELNKGSETVEALAKIIHYKD